MPEYRLAIWVVWLLASAAEAWTEPTAVFTSAQIASPWLMNWPLLSFEAVSSFGCFFAVVVDELPPPPQPEATRTSASNAGKARTRNFGRITGIDASNGVGSLRPRDSNPDYLVQSEACCHYTRAQREYGG